jgi:hypothetical protein
LAERPFVNANGRGFAAESVGWRFAPIRRSVRTVSFAVVVGVPTEGRCLVTLDRDFSDPLRYPPSRYAGIIE